MRRQIGSAPRPGRAEESIEQRTTLSNSGKISGGNGSGGAGDAIYSAGVNASIGSIVNIGSIVGNVEIDNQSNVTIFGVIGGGGKVFGSWMDTRSRHREDRRRNRPLCRTADKPSSVRSPGRKPLFAAPARGFGEPE